VIEYEDPEGIVIYDVIPDPIETDPEKTEEQNRPTLLPNLNQPNGWWTLLMEVALLVALLAAIFIALWLLRRIRIRKIRTLPPADGVRLGYDIMLRLMQMRGFKFFEGELLESFAQRADNLELSPLPMQPIVPILQKGLYGTEEITEEQRAAVADYIEALAGRLFSTVNPIRRIWFTLLLTKKPRYKSMIWKFK
jgi:hypothetical protein